MRPDQALTSTHGNSRSADNGCVGRAQASRRTRSHALGDAPLQSSPRFSARSVVGARAPRRRGAGAPENRVRGGGDQPDDAPTAAPWTVTLTCPRQDKPFEGPVLVPAHYDEPVSRIEAPTLLQTSGPTNRLPEAGRGLSHRFRREGASNSLCGERDRLGLGRLGGDARTASRASGSLRAGHLSDWDGALWRTEFAPVARPCRRCECETVRAHDVDATEVKRVRQWRTSEAEGQRPLPLQGSRPWT